MSNNFSVLRLGEALKLGGDGVEWAEVVPWFNS